MRAVFQKDLDKKDRFLSLPEAIAHHLMVARAKVGDEILILNGKGLRATGIIKSITRKKSEISINHWEEVKKTFVLDLFIGIPRKKYFEKILGIAVELGIGTLHPANSDFSQYRYKKSERLDKILESALIQSNNPFLPNINAPVPFADIQQICREYQHIVYFNSRQKHEPLNIKKPKKVLYVIGPEGGFSEKEERILSNLKNLSTVALPTPILRSPTAVASAAGYLLAHIQT